MQSNNAHHKKVGNPSKESPFLKFLMVTNDFN